MPANSLKCTRASARHGALKTPEGTNMNIMTLNALGITIMAAFGLWAFYRAVHGSKKRKPPRNDDRKDD